MSAHGSKSPNRVHPNQLSKKNSPNRSSDCTLSWDRWVTKGEISSGSRSFLVDFGAHFCINSHLQKCDTGPKSTRKCSPGSLKDPHLVSHRLSLMAPWIQGIRRESTKVGSHEADVCGQPWSPIHLSFQNSLGALWPVSLRTPREFSGGKVVETEG